MQEAAMQLQILVYDIKAKAGILYGKDAFNEIVAGMIIQIG